MFLPPGAQSWREFHLSIQKRLLWWDGLPQVYPQFHGKIQDAFLEFLTSTLAVVVFEIAVAHWLFFNQNKAAHLYQIAASSTGWKHFVHNVNLRYKYKFCPEHFENRDHFRQFLSLFCLRNSCSKWFYRVKLGFHTPSVPCRAVPYPVKGQTELLKILISTPFFN